MLHEAEIIRWKQELGRGKNPTHFCSNSLFPEQDGLYLYWWVHTTWQLNQVRITRDWGNRGLLPPPPTPPWRKPLALEKPGLKQYSEWQLFSLASRAASEAPPPCVYYRGEELPMLMSRALPPGTSFTFSVSGSQKLCFFCQHELALQFPGSCANCLPPQRQGPGRGGEPWQGRGGSHLEVSPGKRKPENKTKLSYLLREKSDWEVGVGRKEGLRLVRPALLQQQKCLQGLCVLCASSSPSLK